MLPEVLRTAVHKGIGKMFKDQYQNNVAGGATVTYTCQPASETTTWVAYAITYGNIGIGNFDVYRSHASIRRTYDPAYTSTGLGAAFFYPCWAYIKRTTPMTFEITNLTGAPANFDATVWVVEVPDSSWDKFLKLMEREESIWDKLLGALAPLTPPAPPTETAYYAPAETEVGREGTPEHPTPWPDEWEGQ